jgi:hypothetical protein
LISNHKDSISGLTYSPIKIPISHKYTISDTLLFSSPNNIKLPQNFKNKSKPFKLKPTPYQQKEEERRKLQKVLLKNQIKYKSLNSKDLLSTSSYDLLAQTTKDSHQYDSLRLSFSRSHGNSAFGGGYNTSTNNYFNNSNYSAIIAPKKKISLYSVKSMQSVNKDYKNDFEKKIIYPVLNNINTNSNSHFLNISSVQQKKAINFNSPTAK